MTAPPQQAAPTLFSELHAQVRRVAEELDLGLTLSVNGQPQAIPAPARQALLTALDSLLSSARSAQEIHSIALEVAYLPDGLHVRIEHDGTFEPAARAGIETSILQNYDAVGRLGGGMSLASGRGFGLRLEITLPYAYAAVGHTTPRDLESTRPPLPPRAGRASETLVERLTPQEEMCLNLLAAGLSNKEIASKMHLGVGTIKFHLAQIYQKLNVQGRGRGAAVARARELGLIFD